MIFDIDAHNKRVQDILNKHHKSLEHDLYKKVVDISIQVAKSGDLIEKAYNYSDMTSFDYKPYREKESLLNKINKLEKQLNECSLWIAEEKKEDLFRNRIHTNGLLRKQLEEAEKAMKRFLSGLYDQTISLDDFLARHEFEMQEYFKNKEKK